MRGSLPLLWLCITTVPAYAQQKTISTAADGFPPLPTFDVKDNYNPTELKNVKDHIEHGSLDQKTSTPLKPEQIAPFPVLGSAAFEVLSKETLFGTFALSSLQADPSMRGVINLSFKRFNKSLESKHMFYRKADTNGDFNSPLFSPNGESVLLRDGLIQDRNDGFHIYLWQLQQGRLRYVSRILKFRHLFWSPGSRYISYIQGGDAFTNDNSNDPQTLCALDTTNRQSAQIMREPGLSWSWTYDGHLLCARVPRDQKLASHARPSVYRVAANGAAPEKLFDGGYYAHQSPDGQNIVFCDWAGELLEPQTASDALKNNAQQGLFVWNTVTKSRTFLGPLAVGSMQTPRAAPQMIWSSDNKRVFVLVPGRLGAQVVGRIYLADVAAKTCKALGQVAFTPSLDLGWFEPRLQLSPDEKRLYLDARERINGPEGVSNLRYTLWQMNTADGEAVPLARLTNLADENPDWDFHDDSGVSSAFVTAQKVEDALPALPIQPLK